MKMLEIWLLVHFRYGRVEPMALGKFSVNVTKCPAAVNGRSLSVPQEVGTFFELITTKVISCFLFYISSPFWL